ncbi:MAG: hypothetical protein JRI68_34925 [Deltaproteobacteria bacterium]|nr:hypothetical protein [Deltaproteobacteria bacterium]
MLFPSVRSFHTALRAGLFIACVALGASLSAPPSWAAGVPVGAATPEQKQAASTAYKAAAAAMKAGNHEEALQGFRASHDIVASPNSHFMVVRVLQAMGRNVEAYNVGLAVIAASLEAAKVDAKYEKTATAARAKLAEVKETIGLVTVNVTAPPGATLTVNGQDVEAARWGTELPVEPGPLNVVLRPAEGGEEARDLSIVAGGVLTVDIAPPVAAGPTTDPGTDQPVPEDDTAEGGADLALYGYIAGGVGAAGMVMFGIFGGLTLGEYSSLEDQCPDNSCTEDQSGDADSGKTYQTVANVSAIIGAVGLAAGTGLIIASLMQEDDGSAEEMAAMPTLSIGPGSVVISGSF